ncbi:MAG: efflux RND transporter periplasmic adaptor subunit [Bryobacteraceae bacterium]|nr:efflux RND transporter periplasmic adaptor subunit [Bryobacteraceae bacterium]
MKFQAIITPVLATGLLLGLASCGGNKDAGKKQADTGPARVRVVPVAVKEQQRSVESVGNLFPFDEAIISSEVDGLLESVGADLGDMVAEGSVLAKISDEEQRYMVAQQEAQLRQSLERLGLKSETDRVQDIRETPDVRRARADLSEAEQRYKRTRELVDQGIGPQSDLDTAQARFQSLQAGYDVTLNQTRNLIQEVERFKASLELQRMRLRDTTVRAPYAAFVKDRLATPGQFVRANSPLFTLVKIDPVRLRIEVPERMAPWVKLGQRVEVTVEAFQDRRFDGKIWRISPTVDQSKRTFVVEALIQNPNRELKPGSYARAKIVTDRVESIRLIPSRALNYVLGTNKAYVVTADGTVQVRDVKLGDRFAQEVEIIEGVELGERVAVGGLNRLEEGAKVSIATGDSKQQAGQEDDD